MCDHKHLKCVNCTYICLDCGQKVEPQPEQKQEPKETPKRKTRKAAKE